MKKILLTLLLLPTLCFSSPQAKKEKVEHLLEAMNASSMLDATYNQMEKMMESMSQQFNIQPEEEAIFENFQKQLFSVMKKEVSWEKMQSPMVDIYVKHYTDQELDDMITFYQSETGRSVVTKMPQVMQESMLLSQSMARGLLPEIQRLSKALQAELSDFRARQ